MGKTKEKLSGGQVTLGGWMMIGHPTVAELMAGEGFDWIGVDMEHTPTELEALHRIVLACKGTGCDVLVRLDDCKASLAKKALDLGAAGIIVPSVNTPETARQAVAMAKFPPQGTRGASLCRATDFGRQFDAYYRRHNNDVVVVVMLEHVDAVAAADAILATPGIDAALIGPYDLSASLGLAGQLAHPEVVAARQKILNACRRQGVPAGIHVTASDGSEVRQRIEEGFHFIACGIDTGFILAGCRQMLGEVGRDA